MTETGIKDRASLVGVRFDVVHLYCLCSPELGRCGITLDEYDEDAPDEDECVVCVELVDEAPCPRCGEVGA